MTKISQTFIDKSTWGDGPWQDEPDRVQWTDETTGLPCLVRRGNPMFGNWCGYAAVPVGHPLHGKGYNDCILDPPCGKEYCKHTPESVLSVHGGLTFAGGCHDDGDGTGICHVPEPGQPDDVWWFGWDAGHFMDLQPGLVAYEAKVGLEPRPHPENYIYCSLGAAQNETEDLARQLLSMQSKRKGRKSDRRNP